MPLTHYRQCRVSAWVLLHGSCAGPGADTLKTATVNTGLSRCWSLTLHAPNEAHQPEQSGDSALLVHDKIVVHATHEIVGSAALCQHGT